MNKLKLDLDLLEVESFHVGADGISGRGTVKGRAPYTTLEPPPPETDNIYCISNPCFNTYVNTCGVSCGGTCFEVTCQSCTCPNVQTCGFTCHHPDCASVTEPG